MVDAMNGSARKLPKVLNQLDFSQDNQISINITVFVQLWEKLEK